VTAAWELIGRPRHLSVHPGGIIITPGPLTDTLPVQWANKGFLITQYDYADLEEIGLPKIDLLGIRALTVLADTADLIRTRHDPDFRLESLPLEDERTAELLRSGQTIGVFQCESSGAQRTLRQLQVKNVPDLAIANAFFKPGPAMGGNYDAFIRRYRGETAVSYLHPALEPILQPTQGVLLFQEQVLRVAVEIAGLSWAQADHLRRGMSKMNRREMALMRLQFVRGCQAGEQPLTAEQAETVWEQVIAFSGYGFNQGHATAYADVSYRSAYLKAHYPAEFLCARLADAGGFHHPAIYMAEARRLGLAVRPPHVNVSGVRFTLADGETGDWRLETPHSPVSSRQSPTLWMGLDQVRDLRQETVRGIIRERPFTNLRDLLARVPMQTKEMMHLIQCGALDGLSDSRAALLAELESVARAGNALQLSFDFGQETAVPAETARQRFEWEQRLLGLPVTVQPLDLTAQGETADDVPLRFLHRLRNQPTTIAGYRLPGWTGDRGFFVSDGADFVIVQMKRTKVPLWEPVRLQGVWREDEWGNGRFEATSLASLPIQSP
jgi:DNA polymerase III alpha subunit